MKGKLHRAKGKQHYPLALTVAAFAFIDYLSFDIYTSTNVGKMIVKYFHPLLRTVKTRANEACREEGAAYAKNFDKIRLKRVSFSEMKPDLELDTYWLDNITLTPDAAFGTYYIFDPATVTCATQSGDTTEKLKKLITLNAY